MSEIKKTCDNCKHCDCSPLEDPCKSCLSKIFTDRKGHTLWEPKEDIDKEKIDKILKVIRENGFYGITPKLPVAYADTVFKTENDLKIDHINERVDSIQHNVLVYGNDIASKIIGIKDQLKEQNDILHNFDTRIDEIDERLCDLDTKLDSLESMLKDIKKTLNNTEEIPEPKWPVGTDNLFEVDGFLTCKFKIVYRTYNKRTGEYMYDLVSDGRVHHNIFYISENRIHPYKQGNDINQVVFDDTVTLTKEENTEKPTPKFKFNDLVKFNDCLWKITSNGHYSHANSMWYYTISEAYGGSGFLTCIREDALTKATKFDKLEKPTPKFKVGDLVRLTSGTKIFEVVKVKEENYGGKLNYRYRLKSVDHGYFQYCPQSYLTRVEPPIIFSKEVK